MTEPIDPPDAGTSGRMIPPWFIPLLIGVVTVTAGLFTWRAGQLGSTAAFQDRTSVGQTITQQRLAVEVNLVTINDAVAYVGYVADFAEATAFDERADEAAAAGDEALATTYRDAADDLRLGASELAVSSELFTSQAVLTQRGSAPDQPLAFDVDQRIAALEAQATTGIGAPAPPDPETWAAKADDTRQQVRGLRWATLLLLIAVVGLTIAQLSDRRITRRIGTAFGLGVYVVIVSTTVATVY